MKYHIRLFLALATTLPWSTVFACASCGCTLNSDWGTQGLSTTTGWSLDVRFDALNQDQLRTGTGTISSAAAATTARNFNGDLAEVEKYTNNRYFTTTLDYNQGEAWGVSLAVPYIARAHSTLGTGSDGKNPDPAGAGGNYDSSTSGVGDVRVTGRYFGFSPSKNFGVQLGLKLPTGSTNQMSNDGQNTFVDPGLQLGTGTTDAIMGVYYFDNLNQDWDYFLQAQFQSALNSSSMNGQSYRPGDSLNLSGGIRYHGFDSFTPTLQVNARQVNTDSGDAADTYATGGTLVYITPGAVIPVTSSVSIYSNLQIPIYQNVNGIQLAPKTIFSIGARFAF